VSHVDMGSDMTHCHAIFPSVNPMKAHYSQNTEVYVTLLGLLLCNRLFHI